MQAVFELNSPDHFFFEGTGPQVPVLNELLVDLSLQGTSAASALALSWVAGLDNSPKNFDFSVISSGLVRC